MPRTTPIHYVSVWWRSRVRVDGDRLIPFGQPQSYDPFEHYFPHGISTRDGLRSLPYMFLNVDSDQMDEVKAFCEKFGVLGNPLRGWESWAWDIEGGGSVDLHRFLAEQPDEDREETRRFLQKRRPDPSLSMAPMSIKAFREAQTTLKRVTEWAGYDLSGRSIFRDLLESIFTLKLAMARPKLRWNQHQSRWQTCWDVGALETAMYLMVLYDIEGGGHILACKRCGKTFLGDHPRTEYCSPKCQNHHKVDRFRRIDAYAEHARLSRDRARNELKRVGIDGSTSFDFSEADKKRSAHASKKQK